jgi:hypothetical protein
MRANWQIAAGDQREEQANAGEAHDVAGDREDAVGEVNAGLRVVPGRRSRGDQPDGGPAQGENQACASSRQ